MTSPSWSFPIAWQAAAGNTLFVTPAVIDELVVFCVDTHAHAFQRATGCLAWQLELPGEATDLASTASGLVVACEGSSGAFLLGLNLQGEQTWRTRADWQLVSQSLHGLGDRFLVSGIDRGASDIASIWVKNSATGETLRQLPGTSYQAAREVDNQLLWVQLGDPQHTINVAAPEHTTGTAQASGMFFGLSAYGNLIHVRDGTENVCMQLKENALNELWRRPGGAAEPFIADDRGVVCGVRSDDSIQVAAYDARGEKLWYSEPLTSFQLSLLAWKDFVVASGVLWGDSVGTAVLDRDTGAILNRESGNWHAIMGSFAADRDAIYCVDNAKRFTRRTAVPWQAIEDSWDDQYLLAVAFQIQWWLDVYNRDLLRADAKADVKALKAELQRLAAGGTQARMLLDNVPVATPASELSTVRGLVKCIRAAGRTISTWSDRFSMLTCALDYPAIHTGIPEDLPRRRVQLLELDELSSLPVWQDRQRISGYPELRGLSLMQNGLTENSLNIALDALPLLETLRLDENSLARLPEQLVNCSALKELSVRANPLTTLDFERLPAGLEVLEISRVGLGEDVFASLQERMPNCDVRIF